MAAFGRSRISIGAAACVSFSALLVRTRGDWTPQGGVGAANAVTLLRLAIVAVMLSALGELPGAWLGAQRVNEPGTWNFSVLRTPDVARALHFYGPLLGWEVSPDLGAGMARVEGYGDHLARTVNPEIDETWGAVAELPPRERAVIVLRYWLDLSEADIAASLGWPNGTVKSTLHRALRRLREELQP